MRSVLYEFVERAVLHASDGEPPTTAPAYLSVALELAGKALDPSVDRRERSRAYQLLYEAIIGE